MKVYEVKIQTSEEECKALGGKYNSVEGLCYLPGKYVKKLIIQKKNVEIQIAKEVK